VFLCYAPNSCLPQQRLNVTMKVKNNLCTLEHKLTTELPIPLLRKAV
jgi:hypothetical protein